MSYPYIYSPIYSPISSSVVKKEDHFEITIHDFDPKYYPRGFITVVKVPFSELSKTEEKKEPTNQTSNIEARLKALEEKYEDLVEDDPAPDEKYTGAERLFNSSQHIDPIKQLRFDCERLAGWIGDINARTTTVEGKMQKLTEEYDKNLKRTDKWIAYEAEASGTRVNNLEVRIKELEKERISEPKKDEEIKSFFGPGK